MLLEGSLNILKHKSPQEIFEALFRKKKRLMITKCGNSLMQECYKAKTYVARFLYLLPFSKFSVWFLDIQRPGTGPSNRYETRRRLDLIIYSNEFLMYRQQEGRVIERWIFEVRNSGIYISEPSMDLSDYTPSGEWTIIG